GGRRRWRTASRARPAGRGGRAWPAPHRWKGPGPRDRSKTGCAAAVGPDCPSPWVPRVILLQMVGRKVPLHTILLRPARLGLVVSTPAFFAVLPRDSPLCFYPLGIFLIPGEYA